MIILVSIYASILLICEILLVKYCQVKKRAMFMFSCLYLILAVVSLMITGDIALAYGG